MAHLAVSLLGPFQVTLGGQPVTRFESNKVRALLAYLALEADRPHRREVLAALLWPEWPEQTARTYLRSALADLLATIDDHNAMPTYLSISRSTIQFNRSSDCWVDVWPFQGRVEGEGPIHPPPNGWRSNSPSMGAAFWRGSRSRTAQRSPIGRSWHASGSRTRL